jgi:acyl-CoA reductase-like NAD-dependent aldehyde dehydrogenase
MSQVIGEKTGPRTGDVQRSVNPANPGETVHEFTPTTATQVREALARGVSAGGPWGALPPGQRAGVLNRVADELERKAAELGRLITREEGKTLSAATGEVRKTAEQFRLASQLAYQVEGSTYPQETPGTFAYTLRSPLGLIVAITPFNFPVSLAARKIAPALAAGNSVIFKPSPVTAGAGAALAEACWAAGVPTDVLQLAQGDDREAMSVLVGSPEVAAVTFTGSDAVGEVLRRTTNTRARLQFELGGHNAAVVCADADLPRAAAAVAAGAFELTGQACTATDRVLVERAVLDEFVGLLAETVRGMKVGPGESPDSTLGPVATAAQHQRLTDLLTAGSRDGTVVAQGEVDSGVNPEGYWIAPTVLADLPADHVLNTREIFGPLLSVVPVESFDEGLTLVNASDHGLVTAVHTTDLRKAHRFAQRVTCGVVKVNDRTTGNGVAPPFGGWKASSSGAFPEGGRTALDFVTDTKTVYFGYEER